MNATHRCKVCGAFWIRYSSSWALASPSRVPGSCCDNAPMGDQIEPAMIITGSIPMRLTCPTCGELHVDEGEFATKPHHTHSCQNCGMTWRPAIVTVGVRFLPGFKNEDAK